MNLRAAEKCEAAAERLAPIIASKRDPAIWHQNLTARRARIADSMRSDAEKLQREQRCLLHLARLHRAGDLPAPFQKITNAAAIHRISCYAAAGRYPTGEGWQVKDHAVLQGAAIPDLETLLLVWSTLRGPYLQEREPTREEKIRVLEQRLIGFKVPGFFPTPASLAERVVQEADIMDGDSVLEPSAGKGDLVEAILQAANDVHVTALEVYTTLAEILQTRFERRDVTAYWTNFLEWHADPIYDRVVMNPPFEKGADREHVLRALLHLKPGGRLVSIMCCSASEGRGWEGFHASLRELCDTYRFEDLPDGSFKGAEAFRQTGVRAVLLVADRAGPDAAADVVVSPQ